MTLLPRLVWHATEGRRNRGWRQRLGIIRRLANADRETFQAWQSEALGEHLGWASSTVPYWQRVAPGATSLADFPVLTRAELQAHWEEVRDPTRPKSVMDLDASGGSTGEPVRLYHDADYWAWECATEAFVHEWWGVRPWSRTAILWGDDRDAADLSWKHRTVERLLGRRTLNVFQLDQAGMDDFLDDLQRFQPEVLMGYASALELCAAHAQRRGGLGFQPKLIRSAAESLFPERRKRIEHAFGQPVRDMYGSRESASMAADGPDGRLYVLGHGRVIELVDDTGAPVAPGVPGRVLVTDLTNRAFGLIRYENGDVASWAPEDETRPCPFPVLERIWGRTSDFLTTPTGGRIHGEWFTHLFYGVESVLRFQVHQRSTMHVDVLTEGSITPETMAPLLEKMRERLGEGVQVRWESGNKIAPGPTGKHRYTVSDVPFLPSFASSPAPSGGGDE